MFITLNSKRLRIYILHCLLATVHAYLQPQYSAQDRSIQDVYTNTRLEHTCLFPNVLRYMYSNAFKDKAVLHKN